MSWNKDGGGSETLQRSPRGPKTHFGCLTVKLAVPTHYGEHAEASLAQQVSQVGDGSVGGDVGGKAALPLGLGQLQGTAQLIERLPAHHRPNEHPIWLQHLVDLRRPRTHFE